MKNKFKIIKDNLFYYICSWISVIFSVIFLFYAFNQKNIICFAIGISFTLLCVIFERPIVEYKIKGDSND